MPKIWERSGKQHSGIPWHQAELSTFFLESSLITDFRLPPHRYRAIWILVALLQMRSVPHSLIVAAVPPFATQASSVRTQRIFGAAFTLPATHAWVRCISGEILFSATPDNYTLRIT